MRTTNPLSALHVKSSSGQCEVSIESGDPGGHRWTLQSTGVPTLAASFQIIDRTLGVARVLINTNGDVGIGTTAPDATLTVGGSADKPGGGSWSSFSDVRLKKNIRPLTDALGELLALRGVQFEYKDPAQTHELAGQRIGMIAQEVEKVFPDWVDTAPNGYKRLTFRGFEALTVEALRELRSEASGRMAGLEAANAELQKELAAQRQRNARLEAQFEELAKSVARFQQETADTVAAANAHP